MNRRVHVSYMVQVDNNNNRVKDLLEMSECVILPEASANDICAFVANFHSFETVDLVSSVVHESEEMLVSMVRCVTCFD